jgi:hypothetical protein
VSKWSIAGAWVLVAALATTMTWQVVSAADAQVSDRPPLQVAAPLSGSVTSSTEVATTSTGEPGTTVTTISDGSSTSTAPDAPTSSAPPTTEAAWASETIPTGGGVVVVRYRTGEVILGSASPAAGFAAEIKKEGPPEVEVEFDSDSSEYRVKAEWSDGGLSVETESDD